MISQIYCSDTEEYVYYNDYSIYIKHKTVKKTKGKLGEWRKLAGEKGYFNEKIYERAF